MSSSTESALFEELGAMMIISTSLQDQCPDENWKEADKTELQSFITAEQQIIPSIITAIQSGDRHSRLIATIKTRRMLEILPSRVCIQPVINSGLVPYVVEMLSSEDTKLRVEAAWCLSNIANGTSKQISTVIDAGATPKLVAMFPTDDSEVQEKALWALGNIGWGYAGFRDTVVKAGGVKPALDVLDAPQNYTEKVRNMAAWALNRYLNSRPGAELGFEVTSPMIPILAKFLRGPEDVSWGTAGLAVKALDRICDSESAAELTIATGILPRVVELCTTGDSDLREKAIHCVAQFTAGNEACTDAAIEAGCLDAFKACIRHPLATIRETAWLAASNVAAGTLTQAHALLNAGLLPILVAVVRDKQEAENPRKEATWTLANLVHTALAHPELVDPIIEGGCIEALSDAMVSHHVKTQSLALESLQKLLSIESRSQIKIQELLKAADGIARLRALWYGEFGSSQRSEVGRTAHGILKDYFPDFVRRARV
ncbi:hypothetical protein FRC04_009787 [Tulasnella sp. 424]|nr:hypothetical protein FRC04_009787 [Tulasnella sp. 424]KAG8971154.1 hypothetical protein FRC05_011438 [Tulasnella sp. 425]